AVILVLDREILALDRFLEQTHHGTHRDAARDFAGLVAAHAVGQHDETDVRVGAERVLVVLADAAGVGHSDAAQLALEVHHGGAPRPGTSVRSAAANEAPS